MAVEQKVVPVLALPALAAIDAQWGLAMGLGMLGGWLARAGIARKEKRSWDEIKDDLIVSLLISGGSIIATLFFAELLSADKLGVATIGFAVTFSGTKAIELLRDFVFAPIINAVRGGEKGKGD